MKKEAQGYLVLIALVGIFTLAAHSPAWAEKEKQTTVESPAPQEDAIANDEPEETDEVKIKKKPIQEEFAKNMEKLQEEESAIHEKLMNPDEKMKEMKEVHKLRVQYRADYDSKLKALEKENAAEMKAEAEAKKLPVQQIQEKQKRK